MESCISWWQHSDMEYANTAAALFQSTDPLNLGSPWHSWAASVKPFYTKHTVVIAFIAALYLPVVYALRDVVECYLPGGFKQRRAAEKKHKAAEAHLLAAHKYSPRGSGVRPGATPLVAAETRLSRHQFFTFLLSQMRDQAAPSTCSLRGCLAGGPNAALAALQTALVARRS